MKSSVANEFSSLFLPRIVGKRGGPIGVFVRRRTRHGTTREDDAYHNKGVGETLLRVNSTLVNTRRRERERRFSGPDCSGRTIRRRSRERRLPDLPPFIRKLFPRGEVDRSVSRRGEEGKRADQRFGERGERLVNFSKD